MKKYNILITILALFVFAVSCETYDDYNTDRPTYIRFDNVIPRPGVTPVDNANVKLNPGDTTRRILQAFISDVSNVDRTFNVVIDQEANQINPENFSFDPTITIPANQRRVTTNIYFENVSFPEDNSDLALKLEAADNDALSGSSFVFKVKDR